MQFVYAFRISEDLNKFPLRNSQNMVSLSGGTLFGKCAKHSLLIDIHCLKFIQSTPNFNCGWGIYTGVKKFCFIKRYTFLRKLLMLSLGGGVSLAGGWSA
jgi:hypothetical protein